MLDENIGDTLNACDVDNDGYLDFNEFLQASIDRSNLLNDANIQVVFKTLDLNGDGAISAKDLKQAFSNQQKVPQKPGAMHTIKSELVAEIIEEVGTGDEEINYDDFYQGLQSVVRGVSVYNK